MKEFWIKILEISKELLLLCYQELKSLYKKLHKRCSFLINKQRTIKEFTSPMLKKRTEELSTLTKTYKDLKKENKILQKNISEKDDTLALLYSEICILQQNNNLDN